MKIIAVLFLVFQSHAQYSSFNQVASQIARDLRNTSSVERLQSDHRHNDSCLATLEDRKVSWLRRFDDKEEAFADQTTARNYARYILKNSPELAVVFGKVFDASSQASGFVVNSQTGLIDSVLLIFNASPNTTSPRMVRKIISKRLNEEVPFKIGPSALDMVAQLLKNYRRPPFARPLGLDMKSTEWNLNAIRADSNYQTHLFYNRALLNMYGFDQDNHLDFQNTGTGPLTILFDMNQVSMPFERLAKDQSFLKPFDKIKNVTAKINHRILLIWDAQHLIEIAKGQLHVHGLDQ